MPLSYFNRHAVYYISMHKVTQFFRSYPHLGVALAVAGIAGILTALRLGQWGEILISALSIFMALRLLIEIVRDLRKGNYGVDILAAVAIVATIAVGEYWATIIIVIMMTSGQALEEYAARRAKAELTSLLERAPKITYLKVGDSTRDIPIGEVAINDMLIIKPGEIIPVDAIISEGSSSIDQSSLTGESLPVDKTVGDELMSGSVNGSSALAIKALRTAGDSQYAQIVELVKAAGDSRAPFVRMADRYAVPFTIISFAIAGFAWWWSGEALRFAEVLVVATPCPLLLGAPIALISGMSRSARHGIIVKSGAVLEQLSRIRAVAFDKTGTLTNGTLAVAAIHPRGKVDEPELLRLAASAEQQSAHIMAEALVAAAHERHLTLLPATDVEEVTAGGVKATLHGTHVLVGKADFLRSRHIVIDEADTHDATAVYVARGHEFIGSIVLADTVRSNSHTTIARLKKLGVLHTLMLTGDNTTTAQTIAASIGITDVRAELLPADKVKAVATFAHRPIMMVGDGVNDAPVLSASDVGIAMGARGATAASESADVVILLDDISKSAEAIAIAQRTISIATQSIMIGIAISVLLMLIAATGVIPAIIGAILQEVVDVVVIINALRAHRDAR